MKSRLRLRRRSDFERAFRGRRVHPGRLLVAILAASGSGIRVGVTSSRQVRGAVARNRVRRRLREAARTCLAPLDSALRDRGIGVDVVLIGRPAILGAGHAELVDELVRVARAVAETAGDGNGPAAGPAR